MRYIVFIISWLICGFIATIFMYAYDVRGQEYDEDYLKRELDDIVMFSCLGYMTLIVFIVIFIGIQITNRMPKSKNILTKFVYWLGNIGVKKDEENK